MINKFKSALLLGVCLIIMTACGPSKNKIIEAQTKYKELVEIHNQAMSAYDSIDENSLNEELKNLSDKMNELTAYNLYDMTDDEIDTLIDTINTLNASYSGYLKTIGEIKISEDSAYLEQITFSVVNNTSKVFNSLKLSERGESDLVTDALEGTSGLKSNQELAGLTIYKDADNTPWILTLGVNDEDGVEIENYKLIIEVGDLNNSGKIFTINWNEEADELTLE